MWWVSCAQIPCVPACVRVCVCLQARHRQKVSDQSTNIVVLIRLPPQLVEKCLPKSNMYKKRSNHHAKHTEDAYLLPHTTHIHTHTRLPFH